MSQPTFEELETLVRAYSQTGYIAEALSEATDTFSVKNNGRKINSLSNRCAIYSDDLKDFADKKTNITLSITHSSLKEIHTYLKVKTKDRGEVIIDPTLGQFISYPQIFLGTKDELRGLFLDESRELLLDDSIWATQEKIQTRERWFEILYD